MLVAQYSELEYVSYITPSNQEGQLTPPASDAKWYPAEMGKLHHLAIKQREK